MLGAGSALLVQATVGIATAELEAAGSLISG
jgi:hypothetical protein